MEEVSPPSTENILNILIHNDHVEITASNVNLTGLRTLRNVLLEEVLKDLQ